MEAEECQLCGHARSSGRDMMMCSIKGLILVKPLIQEVYLLSSLVLVASHEIAHFFRRFCAYAMKSICRPF